MKNSKIYKVAGLSLLGFVAASIGIDRANIGPVASQLAGFCGAFVGALVAQKKRRAPAEIKAKETPIVDEATAQVDREQPH